MSTKTYVSLGNSCSIAYNLRLHKLREESYPFDWVRVTNFNNITTLIDNKFNDFLDIDTFVFKEFSDNFEVNSKMGSYIYKNNYCSFYHEFENRIDHEKLIPFKEKYTRKIRRFLDLLQSNKKIIFIREVFGKIKINKINKFIEKLYEINPDINFNIILITNDNIETDTPHAQSLDNDIIKIYYSDKLITDWTRPELNWLEIFNIF